MKINEKIMNIETSLETSKNFTIKASPKAFKILSSGLYSNKIRAVIRELSCNAYDSHIAANNSEPFVVHIPDLTDNNFYIQDYGTGMSENDIMNLYTTYFDSNKTNSNEFIGALGLGSKSPFSYTDSFVVESIYNNNKSTYLIYIDEKGFPSISKLDEQTTDEHSGLTVKFFIDNNDIGEFVNESIDVLSVFERRPKFICNYYNNDYKNNLLPEIKFKNNYYIFNDYGSYSGCNAYMGNVIYPINLKKLNLSQTVFDFIKIRKMFVKFNIGELDITPSREQLSYIDSTIKTLEIKLSKVYEDYIHNVIEDINNSNSLIELMTKFNNIPYDVRSIIYDSIDRNKFKYDDILYNEGEKIFALYTSEINERSMKMDNDILSLKFSTVRNRKESMLPYLSTTINMNILKYNCDYYISFNNKDDKIYKYNNPKNSYLISVRKYKKSKLSDNDIIKIIKEKTLIQNIKLCDVLEYVDVDQNIKYIKDMSINDIDAVWNWFNGNYNGFRIEKGFRSVQPEIFENKKNIYYLPIYKNHVLKNNNNLIISDVSYYRFIISLFKYINNDKDMTIIFCRNKAIKYVDKLGVPNLLDHIISFLKNNNDYAKDIVIKYYKDKYSKYNSKQIFRLKRIVDSLKCNYLSFSNKIHDSKLNDAIINIINEGNNESKNKIYDLTDENLKYVFNLDIKTTLTNIDLSIYDDIFDLIYNNTTWIYGSNIDKIINILNIIYEYNKSGEKK